MTLTPIQKVPNNVDDLGKIIVATKLEFVPKVQKIAQSGHNGLHTRNKKYLFVTYLLTTRARLSQKPSKTFLRKWLHGSSQLRSETLKYFYLKGWFTLCSKFAAVCNSQLHFYREIRNFLVLHCCSLLRFCRNVSEQASMSVFPKSSFLLIQFIVR